MNHKQLKEFLIIIERIRTNAHNTDILIQAKQYIGAGALFEQVSKDLLIASSLAGKMQWNGELPVDSTSL